MKRLDLTSMENIQGGSAGSFSLNLPITALLSTLGLGALLGIGLSAGIGITYDLGLPFGL